MVKTVISANRLPLLLVLLACVFYGVFAYDLQREDFLKLISLYAGLSLISWKLLQLQKGDFWLLAGISLLFRLVFIVATPNLSQDFYRFIWDGRMILEGWNPYLYLPQTLMEAGDAPVIQAKELHRGMGELSASNYTNYPPLNQLLFALAAFVGGKSILGPVVVMRMIIIGADLGILYFGRKLLWELQLPPHRIFWYILNPFIIIELSGNLHFEGVMLFFLILSLYLLRRNGYLLSAAGFAASILLKLLPLLMLPLLSGYFMGSRKELKQAGRPWWKNRNFYKLLLFNGTVGLLVVLAFVPFVSEAFISNFLGSIGLWFVKFEFNAGIYSLIRWAGYQLKGYNLIGTVGRVLPVLVLLIIAGLSFFRRNYPLPRLLINMLLAVSVYFFLSTTVHPWYIATPLLLSVFTPYRFVLLWSLTVMLSYYTYTTPLFYENPWVLGLEYIPVLGLFAYELHRYEIRREGAAELPDSGRS